VARAGAAADRVLLGSCLRGLHPISCLVAISCLADAKRLIADDRFHASTTHASTIHASTIRASDNEVGGHLAASR
jgi:hypothetical protein